MGATSQVFQPGMDKAFGVSAIALASWQLRGHDETHKHSGLFIC